MNPITPRSSRGTLPLEQTPPKQGRFFRSDSSDSSSSDTSSSHQPSAADVQQTPPQIRKMHDFLSGMETDDMNRDLTRAEATVLGVGLRRLSLLRTPERARKAAAMLRTVTGNLFSQEESSPDSPGMHRKVIAAASPWLTRSLGTLFTCAGTPTKFVDVKHIADGERRRGEFHGGHLLPDLASNPDFQCLHAADSGVCCGLIKGKFSTFFPEKIRDDRMLIAFLQELEVVARTSERQLCRHPVETFFTECYLQDDGAAIRSAFPIFFYGVYAPGSSYNITSTCSISSEEVMEYAKDAPVVFATSHSRIVDIASCIQERTGIPSGIYIEMSKTQ